MSRRPDLDGDPVIIVHLAARDDADVGDRFPTVCTGELARPATSNRHPDVPRILCPACARATGDEPPR